jgi:hypothetical protein
VVCISRRDCQRIYWSLRRKYNQPSRSAVDRIGKRKRKKTMAAATDVWPKSKHTIQRLSWYNRYGGGIE